MCQKQSSFGANGKTVPQAALTSQVTNGEEIGKRRVGFIVPFGDCSIFMVSEGDELGKTAVPLFARKATLGADGRK